VLGLPSASRSISELYFTANQAKGTQSSRTRCTKKYVRGSSWSGASFKQIAAAIASTFQRMIELAVWNTYVLQR
jgi:hypothetical protein